MPTVEPEIPLLEGHQRSRLAQVAQVLVHRPKKGLVLLELERRALPSDVLEAATSAFTRHGDSPRSAIQALLDDDRPLVQEAGGVLGFVFNMQRDAQVEGLDGPSTGGVGGRPRGTLREDGAR